MNKIIGTTVKNYKIQGFLGKGASAYVYEAVNLETNTKVALKIFDKSVQALKKNIKKEVQFLQSLDHPNIIKCYQTFSFNKKQYIVLQYCGKGDLYTYSRQLNKIDQQEVQTHIKKILKAFQYLHSKKIVHRDLKLANILINDSFEIKVADFGLSKSYENEFLITYLGTPMNMAPEILSAQNNKQNLSYTQKCDIWSLGIITYDLIFKDYPFKPIGNQGQNIQRLRKDIMSNRDIFRKNKNLSEQGKNFIRSCLKINPQQRLSMSQLMEHEWMQNSSMISSIRTRKMKQAFGQKLSIIDKFKYIINTEIKIHILNLLSKSFIISELIPDIFNQFEKLYPEENQNYFNFLKLILEKNSTLNNVKINIIFQKQQFSIKAQQILTLKNHTLTIQKIINSKLQQRQNKINKKYIIHNNKQRNLLQFIINKSLQNKQVSKQEINLWKKICEMMTCNFKQNQIVIKFLRSEQQFFEHDQLCSFIPQIFKKQKILQIVNEENYYQYSQQQRLSQWKTEHNYSQFNQQQKEYPQIYTYAKILSRAFSSKYEILDIQNI